RSSARSERCCEPAAMTATAAGTSAPAASDQEPAPVPIARLLISCADRHGIVAAVSSCIARAGANIIQSDQYSTDPEGGRFFMRLELQGGADGVGPLAARFAEVAERCEMNFKVAH